MIEIIGEVGPVKEIKYKLGLEKIEDFYNEKETLETQKSLFLMKGKEDTKKEVINLSQNIKKNLNEIQELQNTSNGLIKNILNFFKVYNKKRKINTIKKKIKYISENFDYYSIQIVGEELRKINRQLGILNSLEKTYKGALGELQIVNFFKNYYSGGILINDFSKTFRKPICTKGCKEKIMSMQIDHIFLSNKGIFLIETKNWDGYVKKDNNYNPIKQAELHNLAFYIYLKNLLNQNSFFKRVEIPKIYNIVVFTGKYKMKSYKPYIKALTFDELKYFINSRERILDEKQTYEIYSKLKNDIY